MAVSPDAGGGSSFALHAKSKFLAKKGMSYAPLHDAV
jgi:hypothetical protein